MDPLSGMKMLHPLIGGIDGGDQERLLFPFMNGSLDNKHVVQGQNGDPTFFWNGGGAGDDGGGSW